MTNDDCIIYIKFIHVISCIIYKSNWNKTFKVDAIYCCIINFIMYYYRNSNISTHD